MHAVALVGFPTDTNSSYLRGPAKAPQAIRTALWNEGANPYSETGVNLKSPGAFIDRGDAPMREDDSDRATIERIVTEALESGMRVLSLGGDHSVTYPIVRAYAQRYPTLSIVHFDAHGDLYPTFEGNRYSHACPFARILEDTTARRLVQIGIRTMTPEQRTIADRYDVKVFGAWDVAAARAALPDGPVYVTLDLDGLDPAFAPGVSHREPGGLSVRDVLDVVKAIPGIIVGADVVEYNPDEDIAGVTAMVAAKFVKEFAARMISDSSA